jgi:hypothetical protein
VCDVSQIEAAQRKKEKKGKKYHENGEPSKSLNAMGGTCVWWVVFSRHNRFSDFLFLNIKIL